MKHTFFCCCSGKIAFYFNNCTMEEIIIRYMLFLREGNGTPLQYSCLENPMDRGAWKAAVHGVAEGRTRLSDFTFTFHFHALEKEMATHSSVLPGESQGRGSLIGCRLWGHTESDMTEDRLGRPGQKSRLAAEDLGCWAGKKAHRSFWKQRESSLPKR